jgi:hypothetical protein
MGAARSEFFTARTWSGTAEGQGCLRRVVDRPVGSESYPGEGKREVKNAGVTASE